MAITPEFVVGFAREAMELTLVICLPMMGVGLAVGIIVSIFQAATQIQDSTLSLVPSLSPCLWRSYSPFPGYGQDDHLHHKPVPKLADLHPLTIRARLAKVTPAR
jgi:hypothetical protein